MSLVPSSVQWGPGGVIPLGALYTHDGDRTMAAGWYATDTNATRMYQSGFIAPSGRFIVGWTASAPNDPGPGLLEGAPRPGSLLHMLRP